MIFTKEMIKWIIKQEDPEFFTKDVKNYQVTINLPIHLYKIFCKEYSSSNRFGATRVRFENIRDLTFCGAGNSLDVSIQKLIPIITDKDMGEAFDEFYFTERLSLNPSFTTFEERKY